MKLALAQYTSVEIVNQSSFITPFSDNLKTHFKDKHYGNDLIEIVIGVICVSPGFEPFFKPKRPQYIKDKKTFKTDGFSYDVEKSLGYDIKLDFEKLKNGTELERMQQLAFEIISSLSIFDKMKTKIKDFNFEKFKVDLEAYFKDAGFTLDEASQDHVQNSITTKDQILVTDLNSALKQFEECSVKHVSTIGLAAPGAAGDSYQKLLEAVDYLKAHNAIEELEKFNNHPESAVQLMAASFLLPTKAQLAGEILNRISKLDSKESFIAKMLLQDLKSGNL